MRTVRGRPPGPTSGSAGLRLGMGTTTSSPGQTGERSQTSQTRAAEGTCGCQSSSAAGSAADTGWMHSLAHWIELQPRGQAREGGVSFSHDKTSPPRAAGESTHSRAIICSWFMLILGDRAKAGRGRSDEGTRGRGRRRRRCGELDGRRWRLAHSKRPPSVPTSGPDPPSPRSQSTLHFTKHLKLVIQYGCRSHRRDRFARPPLDIRAVAEARETWRERVGERRRKSVVVPA